MFPICKMSGVKDVNRIGLVFWGFLPFYQHLFLCLGLYYSSFLNLVKKKKMHVKMREDRKKCKLLLTSFPEIRMFFCDRGKYPF